MQTYAAVDLHSNNGFLAIIDETDRVLKQRKLPNRLERFVEELEPYRSTLQGVAVESTFNWYWLVDGLQAKEFPVVLVNTSAIQQYSGLKHSDDQYDAWWLAHMMRLGILPTGYIYPREQRAVRDLLRKRTTLVRQRTANILSVQNLEQRNRGTKISSNEVKRLTSASIAAVYDNEDLALALTTTIKVIEALTEQTNVLERAVLKKARLRDEFEPLLSVWGIGKILALTIMYEAGDMNRFASPGNFASYCRCVDAQWSRVGPGHTFYLRQRVGIRIPFFFRRSIFQPNRRDSTNARRVVDGKFASRTVLTVKHPPPSPDG